MGKYYPVLTNDLRCGSTTQPRGRYGMRNPRALVVALGWCSDIRLLKYMKTPGDHLRVLSIYIFIGSL